MHSETLRACGIVVESVLTEEKGYFLARARRGEKRLVAEVTSAGSGFVHSWPSSTHLVPPIEARNLPGELRLLVFDAGSARFLIEDIHERPFNPGEASEVLGKAAEALAGLEASGVVAGYVGPESLLRESSGRVVMLAGRRGVPSGPFTPPETIGRRPSDPRSDVFSLGTLYLRLLAGSDDRDTLVEAWNRLDPATVRHLSSLLEQDPLNRPSGVIQAAAKLASTFGSQAPELTGPENGQPGFRREVPSSSPRPKRKGTRLPGKRLRVAGLAVAAVAVLLLAQPWKRPEAPENPDPEPRFNSVPHDSTQQSPPDTVAASVSVDQPSLEDSAVVWVSNGTGTEGVESAFRSGAAGAYSFVYPSRGATRRRTSLVLVRRENPDTQLSQSVFYPAAMRFASQDSAMGVKPTDITVLLGTDLYHPGINQARLTTPTAAGDTLFVDIANHGIQYTLEGMGAASWMASKLNGKAITIDGTQWILGVSDIRDGDLWNDEIGIPAVLDGTMFLYKPGSTMGPQIEAALRGVFQALPSAVQGQPQAVPVPDIHVLLGAP
ncbi:MAG: hypothetical protein R6V62_08460 [Candidatus Fermentibacteraceae bacterium]